MGGGVRPGPPRLPGRGEGGARGCVVGGGGGGGVGRGGGGGGGCSPSTSATRRRTSACSTGISSSKHWRFATVPVRDGRPARHRAGRAAGSSRAPAGGRARRDGVLGRAHPRARVRADDGALPLRPRLAGRPRDQERHADPDRPSAGAGRRPAGQRHRGLRARRRRLHRRGLRHGDQLRRRLGRRASTWAVSSRRASRSRSRPCPPARRASRGSRSRSRATRSARAPRRRSSRGSSSASRARWTRFWGACARSWRGGHRHRHRRLRGAIVPFCEQVDEVDDRLTLQGLKLIWERNATSRSVNQTRCMFGRLEGIALAAGVRPHPFEVSVDDLDRVKVVRVQGEVDAATAPRVGETVNRLLAEGARGARPPTSTSWTCTAWP